MAFIGSPTFSNAGINSINPANAANALADPQMREVFLGQLATAVIIKAVMSFDDPVTSQSQPQSQNNPTQNTSTSIQNSPNYGGGFSNSNSPPANQMMGGGNLTEQGGLSFGGGFRLGGGGAPLGLSAAGTTTVNREGYQTSGGVSFGGLSANAGLKINSGGVQLSGGIRRAQVGQGLVGNKVGPQLVGP